MKRSAKISHKLLLIGALLLPLSVVGCGGKDGGGGGKAAPPEIEDGGNIDGDDNVDEKTDGDDIIGEGNSLPDTVDNARPKVRNFSQFLHTHTGILGLDPQNSTIAAEFELLETSLPTGTGAVDFLGSHQLTLVKLGSYLCDQAYRTKSAEEREMIFGVDPDATVPIDAFTTENTMEIGKTMMSRFWGLEKEAITDDDENLVVLMGLAAQGVADLEEFNPAMTDADKVRLTVTGMCTAAITSAQVSFYGY